MLWLSRNFSTDFFIRRASTISSFCLFTSCVIFVALTFLENSSTPKLHFELQQVYVTPSNNTTITNKTEKNETVYIFKYRRIVPVLENLNQYITRPAGDGKYVWPSSKFLQPNAVERDRMNGTEPSKDKEEFTIMMLTYKRTETMLRLLKHLNELPKLNKVLIIWNNKDPPHPGLKWPNVTYPVKLLSNKVNTLHNRYLPLSIVQTEAVFLLDDDLFALHYHILEAFRIWQDSRDRLVGFHGRGVKWIGDGNSGHWIYDRRPKSVSLILTGSCFIHKKYFDLYTYRMPKAMRRVIDKTMNCDDIATNFLVSNVTQKSPIEVQHNETFRCPGCKDNGLWMRGSHFKTRNNCINTFVKIFGYIPLFKDEKRPECSP